MIEFLSTIASKYANLYLATLWIPKQYFPDLVHFLIKEFMGRRKPQGWEFNIHLYSAVDFGEFIEARRYEVHLCRKDAEINQHLIKFLSSQYESKIYDFKKCLKKSKSKMGEPI